MAISREISPTLKIEKKFSCKLPSTTEFSRRKILGFNRIKINFKNTPKVNKLKLHNKY